MEDKYGRLWAFVKTSLKFKELDILSQQLLKTQLDIMDAYINILKIRLDNWKEQ